MSGGAAMSSTFGSASGNSNRHRHAAFPLNDGRRMMPDNKRTFVYGFFNPETGKAWDDLEEARRYFRERDARIAQEKSVKKRSYRTSKPWWNQRD
jgi:hypothetical protein